MTISPILCQLEHNTSWYVADIYSRLWPTCREFPRSPLSWYTTVVRSPLLGEYIHSQALHDALQLVPTLQMAIPLPLQTPGGRGRTWRWLHASKHTVTNSFSQSGILHNLHSPLQLCSNDISRLCVCMWACNPGHPHYLIHCLTEWATQLPANDQNCTIVCMCAHNMSCLFGHQPISGCFHADMFCSHVAQLSITCTVGYCKWWEGLETGLLLASQDPRPFWLG